MTKKCDLVTNLSFRKILKAKFLKRKSSYCGTKISTSREPIEITTLKKIDKYSDSDLVYCIIVI